MIIIKVYRKKRMFLVFWLTPKKRILCMQKPSPSSAHVARLCSAIFFFARTQKVPPKKEPSKQEINQFQSEGWASKTKKKTKNSKKREVGNYANALESKLCVKITSSLHRVEWKKFIIRQDKTTGSLSGHVGWCEECKTAIRQNNKRGAHSTQCNSRIPQVSCFFFFWSELKLNAARQKSWRWTAAIWRVLNVARTAASKRSELHRK